jgi:glutamate racemase
MKIGIFDSGLGGLLITHGLTTNLPAYDYIYLGDTARVPYGNRSQATIYEFTRQAVDYLFAQDCELIIIACNTASAEALRQIQQQHLPKHHPGKNVLGVLIPAAEATVAAPGNRIGVLATTGTINSGAFEREIKKLKADADIIGQAAPLLVPLIENDGVKFAGPILDEYLQPLKGIDTLILGCTHYPYMKGQISDRMGESVTIIAQNEIIPEKLRSYLKVHDEIASKLTRNSTRKFLVTDLTDQAVRQAAQLYGQSIELELVSF